MLKKLRTNTKWVMIVVAVCFVGMMVFAWGMDITGRRGAQAGVIGVINGRKVTYEFYNQMIQNQRESTGKDQRITLDTERRLYDDVWNQIIMQTLVDQEISKRKISYTDKELIAFMTNNPVQGVEQAQIFQNPDGTFSREKYREFILNPENLKNPQTAQFLQYIEEHAKNTLPIMKLQQRIAGSILVPESKVREKWLQDNDSRKIEYVFLPSSQAAPPDQPLDEKEVRAYYTQHREDFRRTEERSLDFVFFRLAATAGDSTGVLDRALLIVDRARKGENFSDLANGFSEDPGNQDAQGKGRGGELGFIGRNRMVKEFEDVAFSLKPGEISAPFLTRFGYHIVTVDSVKYGVPASGTSKRAREVTEVKVRHILLKIEPSSQTRDTVENAVNNFIAEISRQGADFAAVAKKSDLEVIRTPLFKKDDTYIPYIGSNISLLIDRVFRSKTGEILPRYQVDSGFFAIKVAEVKPAGIRSLADVNTAVKNEVRREMGVKKAAEFAERVLNRMKAGKTIYEAVAEDEVKTSAVQSALVTIARNVSGLGARSPLVAKAFELNTAGENTGVVTTDKGAGIAVLQEKIPVDESRYKAESEQLRQQMQEELQNEVITQYLDNLRKTAKITDNRSQLLNM